MRASARRRCGATASRWPCDEGQRVLSCAPAMAESQLSFAGVADLLDGVLDDALPALPAPQRHALEVALLLEEADGPPPDERAIGGAVLAVLHELGATAPVLVAVDDVQWLDEPSRSVLEFVVRRLGDEPTRLLLARRGAGDDEAPLNLDRAFARGTDPARRRRSAAHRRVSSPAPAAAGHVVPPTGPAADPRELGRQPVLRPRVRPRVGPPPSPVQSRRPADRAGEPSGARR